MSTYDYEYICAYCGKKFSGRKRVNRKYCSTECQRIAYGAAQRKPSRNMTEPIVPASKCRKCLYGASSTADYPGCSYLFATGESRVKLHPEGLTAKCEEYIPRRGKKLRVGISINGGGSALPFVVDAESGTRDANDLRKIQEKIKAYCLE